MIIIIKLTKTHKSRVKLIKLNMYTNFKDDIRDNFYYYGIIGRKSTNAVIVLLLLVLYYYMNVI